jgi:hypothetical protein
MRYTVQIGSRVDQHSIKPDCYVSIHFALHANPYVGVRFGELKNLIQIVPIVWRYPPWVTCRLPDCVSATAGVPQIAADLLQHDIRQPSYFPAQN